MAKSAYPSHQLDKFMLRLPDGMRRNIEEEAAMNGRSMNAEIVNRLERSFQYNDPESGVAAALHRMEDLTRELIARLEKVDPEFAASRANFTDEVKAGEIYRQRAEAKKPQPSKPRRKR
jgi:hypothetical protein